MILYFLVNNVIKVIINVDHKLFLIKFSEFSDRTVFRLNVEKNKMYKRVICTITRIGFLKLNKELLSLGSFIFLASN